MSMLKWIRVRELERVVVLRDGWPVELLRPGRYLRLAPLGGLEIERFPVEKTWIESPRLRLMVKAGLLENEAIVLDLKDAERAILSIEGRLAAVLGPGLAAFWTSLVEVGVDRYEVRPAKLDRPDLPVVVDLPGARERLTVAVVPAGSTGLVLRDGQPAGELGPGLAAFWKGAEKIEVVLVDRREQALDVAGQEILTADKVTLRLNALVVYRVVDPLKAVTSVEAYSQALYRQAQLALRAVVGARELEAFLAGKDEVVAELRESLAERAAELGVEVSAFGIRDVILPGEMKEILNRVVEARKRAEAALVTRREETAAIRMQANTARIFESNPTLMKLRELEVLEQVAGKANLTVVLGEGGLSERVVKML